MEATQRPIDASAFTQRSLQMAVKRDSNRVPSDSVPEDFWASRFQKEPGMCLEMQLLTSHLGKIRIRSKIWKGDVLDYNPQVSWSFWQGGGGEDGSQELNLGNRNTVVPRLTTIRVTAAGGRKISPRFTTTVSTYNQKKGTEFELPSLSSSDGQQTRGCFSVAPSPQQLAVERDWLNPEEHWSMELPAR